MKRFTTFVAALAVCVGVISVANGQTLYWDIDGATNPGAGGATPAGTWDTATTANWTTDSTGSIAGTTWAGTGAETAVFSAGSDATGAYTVTVSGTQSASAVTVEEGTVQLGTGLVDFGATNGNVTVNNGATLSVTGAGAGTIGGTNGITKNGTGTLLLGNVAQPYSRASGAILTISSGVVEFTSTGSTSGNDNVLGTVPGTATAAAVTINGGTLRWNGSAAHTLSVTRGITIGASGGTIEVVPTSNTGLSLPGAATFTLNGAGTLTKTGAGRFTLNTTSNSFTGKYIVNQGTLNAAGDGRFGLVPASPVADYFILNGGALREGVTTGQTWSANRGITLGAGGGTLMQPGANTATDSLTYNGIIAGTAGGGLTIAATDAAGGGTADGIVILGGANTYNGSTTINTSMTLRIGTAANVVPDASNVTVKGILDLNGNNETVGTVIVNDAAASIIAGTGTPTLTGSSYSLRSSNTTSTTGIQAILGGSAAATKTTAGTVLLGAVNTYTGNTTISAGILSIDSDATLGDGTGTLNLSGGTLNTTANRSASTAPVANPINMTADSAITTSSTATTVDLNLSSSTVGGTAGTLTFRNDGADASTDQFQPRFSGSAFDFARPIVVDNGAVGKTVLQSYNGTGTTQTFSNVISGTGAYTRNASTAGSGGITIFTAANTYSGGTSVSRGTLLVNNTSGSGTGSGAVTVGGNGILAGTGSIDGLVTVNNFGIIAPGNSIGTLTTKGGLTLQPAVAMGDPGATLNMELGAPGSPYGTSDLIDVTLTDGLTINGGTVNPIDAGGLGIGTYKLIDYVGTLGGSVSNLVLGTQPAGFSYLLVDNGANTSIDLQVSAVVAGVPGDYNGNGVVDGADYVVWRKNNGLTGGATVSQGDGTGDGNVDNTDYDYWRARFGNISGSGSGSLVGGSAVPEPSTVAMLLLGIAAAGFRRRGR